MLTKIIDGGRKTGIMQEILKTMVARGSDVAKKTKGEIYDPELMKVVLEEMCVEGGVRIQLHTQLVGAVTDAKKRLVAIVTESKSGRQAWVADRFVDCSGDGDLAAQAGCQFEVGVNANCECQPMSLMALLTGLDAAAIPEYVREVAGEKAKSNMVKLMRDSGIKPSYSAPTLRLRVAEQRPYGEVAALLGCSEGAARVRVSRGLTRLAEELEVIDDRRPAT